MPEIFKPVPGFEGLYEVSDKGRVRSLDMELTLSNGHTQVRKGRVLKANIHKRGYLKVTLTKNGKHYTMLVHRLVAQTFIPNPDNLPEVNHIDGIKTHNTPGNLEWVTSSDNQTHAIETGLQNTSKGENHYKSKPVIQSGIDGAFVNEFISGVEASEFTGINASHINECCRGKRNSAGGYKWNFKVN